MAKIKFGMIVTDGRGKLGGQVFSKNRGGAYIRSKVTPTNPQSTAQTIVRQSFAEYSQNWSALTATLITAWNASVSSWSKTDIFGDLRNPTGKNLYLRLNQNATLAGYPGISSPPEKAEMISGIVTIVLFSVGNAEIILDGRYVGSGARVVISSSGAVSNGTSYVKNLLRVINTGLGSTLDDVDTFDNYVAKFGTPVVGQKVFFGIKYVLENGQTSPTQIVETIVEV
jgi:hypothetical protein